MGKLNFGKLMLFALISIMFLQFTEMNAQYNRTSSQRQTTSVSVDGNELLGRLFKKNKDKEKSKKEKNDKKEKEKKGDVDNSLWNEKDATTRIVEPQLKESSPLAKDEVSLIVSGDGSTKEEATKAALMSAIEQAFGTFVSSNTKILNDELVKDEIVTVASGNIKSYKYLIENEQNGKYSVVIQTIVSTNKLIDYVKSKGGEVELAGANFAMNVRLERFYARNAEIAIKNLLKQMEEMVPYMFDYEIGKVSPMQELTLVDHSRVAYTYRYGVGDYFCCRVELIVKANNNAVLFNQLYQQIRNIEDKQNKYTLSDIGHPLMFHTMKYILEHFRLVDDLGEYGLQDETASMKNEEEIHIPLTTQTQRTYRDCYSQAFTFGNDERNCSTCRGMHYWRSNSPRLLLTTESFPLNRINYDLLYHVHINKTIFGENGSTYHKDNVMFPQELKPNSIIMTESFWMIYSLNEIEKITGIKVVKK